MTSLLNDYLKQKKLRDSIPPGSRWREKRSKVIHTVLRVEGNRVYYENSLDSGDVSLKGFIQYVNRNCECLN